MEPDRPSTVEEDIQASEALTVTPAWIVTGLQSNPEKTSLKIRNLIPPKSQPKKRRNFVLRIVLPTLAIVGVIVATVYFYRNKLRLTKQALAYYAARAYDRHKKLSKTDLRKNDLKWKSIVKRIGQMKTMGQAIPIFKSIMSLEKQYVSGSWATPQTSSEGSFAESAGGGIIGGTAKMAIKIGLLLAALAILAGLWRSKGQVVKDAFAHLRALSKLSAEERQKLKDALAVVTRKGYNIATDQKLYAMAKELSLDAVDIGKNIAGKAIRMGEDAALQAAASTKQAGGGWNDFRRKCAGCGLSQNRLGHIWRNAGF